MPLGTEVRLGPGHIVLDGDPAPPPTKVAQEPRLCLLWPRSPISATAKLLFILFLCYSKLEQWLKISVVCADGSFTAVSYIFVRRMLALFVLTPVVHWFFDCIILIVLYIFCQLSKRNEGAHRLLCDIDLAFRQLLVRFKSLTNFCCCAAILAANFFREKPVHVM